MIRKLKKELLTYISGGMSNYVGYNYNFFKGRGKKYREAGFKIVDPSFDINPVMENGKEITVEQLHQLIDAGKYTDPEAWKCFLRGDIMALITKIDQIYMLKGWLCSKGARF